MISFPRTSREFLLAGLMGSSASISGGRGIESLCPVCFDLSSTKQQPSPPQSSSSSSLVHYRPSTLDAWLGHWDLPHFVPLLDSFDISRASSPSAAQLRRVQSKLMSSSAEKRWRSALRHLQHLREATEAFDSLGTASLQLWLESWRLSRVADLLGRAWNCRTRDDVMAIDVTVAEASAMGMRPLEIRRWRRGCQLLKCGVQAEVRLLQAVKILSCTSLSILRCLLQYLDGLNASLPTLKTWLATFELGQFYEALEAVSQGGPLYHSSLGFAHPVSVCSFIYLPAPQCQRSGCSLVLAVRELCNRSWAPVTCTTAKLWTNSRLSRLGSAAAI